MAFDKKKSVLSVVGPVLMATGCVAVAAAGAAMGSTNTDSNGESITPRTASMDPTQNGLRG